MTGARRVEILSLDGGAPRAYELREQLGRGAMGSVHRAYDLELGRFVALKVLEGDGREARWQRFLREGQAVAALSHPGVVPIYGAGLLEGRPCLILALVEEARALDAAWQGAPRAERLDILLQVCQAMGAAHAAGIVHRDLKPDNVLVDPEGRAYVSDFGVALVANSERMTRTGAVVGTVSTMAPEQIGGQRDRVGPASDVWALGVLLYLALTDRLPFSGATVVETMALIAQASPLPPRSLDPTVSPSLEVVCLRCLQADPSRRYPDAGALGEALARARQAPPHGPRSGLALASGAIALAGLAALALALVPRGLPSSPSPTPSAPSTPPRPSPSTTPLPSASPVGAWTKPPRLVHAHELELPQADWRVFAATPDAVWIAENSRALRFPRKGETFGLAEPTSVSGYVWGAASAGDKVWVAHGERPAKKPQRTWKPLPPCEVVISELSAGAPPRRVWSGRGDFLRKGWFLAWAAPQGGARLLLSAGGVRLISLDPAGRLLDERPIECPVSWIRGAVHLPHKGQFALCGNGPGRLAGFIGAYDDRSGELVWSADLKGTAVGLADAPDPSLFVGVRERRRVALVATGREPEELSGTESRGAVQALSSHRGWLFVLSAGVGEPELAVIDPREELRVSRVNVPRGLGRLYWDAPGDALWVVGPWRAVAWRDASSGRD